MKCISAIMNLPGNRFQSPSQTIGAVIRDFKSAVTKRINVVRQTPHVSVWQWNYYEHIIRYDAELNKVREYIGQNPLKWKLDKEKSNNL